MSTIPASARVAPPRGAAALRASTRDLHDRAEAVTRLPESLHCADDVGGLLGRWRCLALVLEPHAGTLVPSLVPAIDEDLARLGANRPHEPGPPWTAGDDESRLGVAWVLLGARLGLRSMADHAERLVGHELTAMRSTQPSGLRDVRQLLDDLPDDGIDRATAAARTAFHVAITELGGPPWQP